MINTDQHTDLLPTTSSQGGGRMDLEHLSWFSNVVPTDLDDLDLLATRADVHRVLDT